MRRLFTTEEVEAAAIIAGVPCASATQVLVDLAALLDDDEWEQVPLLGELTRQHEVVSSSGVFIARLDLCKPSLGCFFELDGQQHRGQPVYDAARETAVVAATGWLPGRFTWHQITRTPRWSQRRMAQIAARAADRHAA